MEKDATVVKDEFSVWDFNSIIQYVKQHYIQLLLLLLVPIIIYTIDHISNINAMIFGLPSAVPGLPSQNNKLPIKTNLKVTKKRGGFKK